MPSDSPYASGKYMIHALVPPQVSVTATQVSGKDVTEFTISVTLGKTLAFSLFRLQNSLSPGDHSSGGLPLVVIPLGFTPWTVFSFRFFQRKSMQMSDRVASLVCSCCFRCSVCKIIVVLVKQSLMCLKSLT